MKVSRRKFIKAVGAIACAAILFSSFANVALSGFRLHGSAVTPSSFNGGLSQVNPNYIGIGGEFPFLNLVKGSQVITYSTGANAGGQVSPQYNDGNGYPTQCPGASSNCYQGSFFIPPTTVRGGTYSMTWTGGDAGTIMKVGGFSASGSLTGANDGTRWVTLTVSNPSPTAQGVQFGAQVISTSPSNYVSNIAIVYTGDLAAYNSGIFGTQFKSVIHQGGFGVIRFLNWALYGSPNMTTWATRKPVNYITYADSEYRATLFAGTTSEGSFNGLDYAITPLAAGSGYPGYSWPGYSSGAPLDKQIIHVYFDQNATDVNSSITFTGTTTINWASNGFSGGEPIGFTTNGSGFPTNIDNNVTYYVLSAGLTGSSFQVGLTPGGSPVAFGTGASGTYIGTRLATINFNSSGAVPIKLTAGQATVPGTLPNQTSAAVLATLVYDADFNSWLLAGGRNDIGGQGLGNGAPYEIMLQLCKEMGAHPWFPAPFMAVDPMTDFHTQLASYIKNNMPSWMIPRFETPNESWNPGNFQTQYGFGKTFVHWNSQFAVGQNNINDWVGKVASTIGQAVNASYGGAVGAGYQIVIGQWTTTFTSAGANGNTPRLEATNYVAQTQPAQSGYSKTAAYLVSTHIAMANYFNPTERATSQETTDAATFATEAAQVYAGISAGTLTLGSPNSGATPNGWGNATFSAAIAGTTLTVQSGTVQGTIAIGQAVSCINNPNVSPGTVITGGSGLSWTVNNSQTVSNQSMASVALLSGQTITDQYGLIPPGVTITGGSGAAFTISNSSVSVPSGAIVYATSSAGTALATAYADTAGGTAALSGDQQPNLAMLKNYVSFASTWAATYINNAGHPLGDTNYEGGYSPDLGGGNTHRVDQLRNASKFSIDVGLLIVGGTLANSVHVTGNYPDMISAGVLFPSLFQQGGTTNIWSVLDPDVYATPTSSQWNAIASYH